jgi:hypothetical protein
MVHSGQAGLGMERGYRKMKSDTNTERRENFSRKDAKAQRFHHEKLEEKDAVKNPTSHLFLFPFASLRLCAIYSVSS